VTIAGAIFLIVAGAILRYGLNLHIRHVNEDVIGLILIIAGVIGLILSLFQETLWADRARRRDRYYDDPRV
jgi:hypothetical protein